MAWGRLATNVIADLEPKLDHWKQCIFHEEGTGEEGDAQGLIDRLEDDLSATIYNAALGAFGLPPVQSIWPWGLQYIPRGPIPEYLPPEWYELLRERWKREHSSAGPRQPTRSVRRQAEAIWKRYIALEGQAVSLDLGSAPVRSQWRVVRGLMELDSATTGGSLTWGDIEVDEEDEDVSTQKHSRRTRDDPAKVAPTTNAAAAMFREEWQNLLTRNPQHELTARWDDEVDAHLFDVPDQLIDLDPMSADDWTQLRSLVPRTIQKGNAHAAIANDGYARVWRKRLMLIAQMVWPAAKQEEQRRAMERGEVEERYRQSVRRMIEVPPREHFEAAVDAMDELIVVGVMAMVRLKCVPQRWRERMLTPVRKPSKPRPRRGEADRVDAFRPIAWGSQLGGGCFGLLTDWLYQRCESTGILSGSQTGFRSHVGAASAIPLWIGHVASRRAIQTAQSTALVSLDLSNAYDSVPVDALVDTLAKVGIGRNVLAVLRSAIATQLRVKVGNSQSLPFEATAGVPQGFPGSPLLFSIYMERALRYLNKAAWEARGILDREDERDIQEPCVVAYADDTCILARSLREAQHMADVTSQRFTQLGLKLNPAKSRFMALFPALLRLSVSEQNPSLRLNGQEVALVRAVKVLGTLLDEDLSFKPATVEACRHLAMAKAQVLRSVSTGSPALAIRIFHAIGVGRIMHTLPIIAPAMATQRPWKPEGIFRKGLRVILGLPCQAASGFTLHEAAMVPLTERSAMLRQKLVQEAREFPDQAGLLRQVVMEQMSRNGAGNSHIPFMVQRRALQFLDIFRTLQRAPLTLEQCHVRHWNTWRAQTPLEFTEPDTSPLRWLHMAGSELVHGAEVEPVTRPVWTTYAPGGTTARAMSALRAGWFLHSEDITRLVGEESWWQMCEQCTADPRHLVSCPRRQLYWNIFTNLWFPRLGEVKMGERLGLLCAEAPHRCNALPMPDHRRQHWREAFQFNGHHTRRRFWAGLLQLLRRLLQPPLHITQTDHESDGEVLESLDSDSDSE